MEISMNRNISILKRVLIVLNLLIFIVLVIFNQQASVVSKIFPKRTGDVSDKYPTDLTPAGATFSIWGAIYLFQAAWIIYSLSFLVRQNSPDILPDKFYIAYIFSQFFNISWLIVWAHEKFSAAFVILVLISISLEVSLFFAFKSLEDYLQKISTSENKLASKIDVWCVRVLVQNGIIFYTAWVSIASCVNASVSMQADLHLSRSKAGTICLAVLLTVVITWFALENFVIRKYTKFVFAEYIVLVLALSGVLAKQWTDGSGNQAFVLAILVTSAVLLVLRVGMIIFRDVPSCKRQKTDPSKQMDSC